MPDAKTLSIIILAAGTFFAITGAMDTDEAAHRASRSREEEISHLRSAVKDLERENAGMSATIHALANDPDCRSALFHPSPEGAAK